MTAKLNAGRGRPRAFDTQAALATGQRLFHAKGYDAVGLALLTESLGIKPPSFYAAFGSKADFFGQVLERYAASSLPLEGFLRPGRPPVEALAELIGDAARSYAEDPEVPGCLVLEAARGSADEDSARLARRVAQRRRDQIRAFVAETHPLAADGVVDYVVSTMSGLSASAREGFGEARLSAIAQTALPALQYLLR